MNCLNSIGNGYQKNVGDYVTYYPQCNDYMVLNADSSSFTCVETCTNSVLDSKGTKVCLDNF